IARPTAANTDALQERLPVERLPIHQRPFERDRLASPRVHDGWNAPDLRSVPRAAPRAGEWVRMMDTLEADAVHRIPQLAAMRVAYLGPIRNPEQCGNFAALLDAAGMECFTIPSSESSEVYSVSLPGIPRSASRVAGKGLRFVSQLAGTVHRDY